MAGGGAAGFLAAITCAEASPGARVTLFEATAHPLAKVRISGGGRCNVTHACFEPRDLATYFPRGGRELLGPFHRWQPRDTIAWFTERGVELKTEEDGRMFPVTDDSATIVDCLMGAAEKAGVKLRTGLGVRRASAGAGFSVTLSNGESVPCDRLLLATGGGRASAGFAIAQSLGHTLEPLVPPSSPSISTIPASRAWRGSRLPRCWSGCAAPGLAARGPLLITHQGLSGPAVLKLSSWAARELAARDYRFTLGVSWVGGRNREEVV